MSPEDTHARLLLAGCTKRVYTSESGRYVLRLCLLYSDGSRAEGGIYQVCAVVGGDITLTNQWLLETWLENPKYAGVV